MWLSHWSHWSQRQFNHNHGRMYTCRLVVVAACKTVTRWHVYMFLRVRGRMGTVVPNAGQEDRKNTHGHVLACLHVCVSAYQHIALWAFPLGATPLVY
jgi:hypothetical protein